MPQWSGQDEVTPSVVATVVVLTLVIVGLVGWLFLRPQPSSTAAAPPAAAVHDAERNINRSSRSTL